MKALTLDGGNINHGCLGDARLIVTELSLSPDPRGGSRYERARGNDSIFANQNQIFSLEGRVLEGSVR